MEDSSIVTPPASSSTSNQAQVETAAASITLRRAIADSLRFWEPIRILYNAILALIVIGHALAYRFDFANGRRMDALLILFVLAVLANVCYCAAHIVDCLVHYSAIEIGMRPIRWGLFAVGTFFAAILTHYFSLMLFGGPGID
jgi:hypothetical protein